MKNVQRQRQDRSQDRDDAQAVQEQEQAEDQRDAELAADVECCLAEIECCLAEIDAVMADAERERDQAGREFAAIIREMTWFAIEHADSNAELRRWQARYAHLGLSYGNCCGMLRMKDADGNWAH